MVHLPELIQDMALILLVGALVTILFKRIKQPLIMGYIIAGFLVGPHFSYLPTIVDHENIDTFAEIGVIMLLFSLGLEFSFKKLLKVDGSASTTAVVEIVFDEHVQQQNDEDDVDVSDIQLTKVQGAETNPHAGKTIKVSGIQKDLGSYGVGIERNGNRILNPQLIRSNGCERHCMAGGRYTKNKCLFKKSSRRFPRSIVLILSLI